jgi:hypothetical protein
MNSNCTYQFASWKVSETNHSRNLATQQSRNLAMQRNNTATLQRNNHAILQRNNHATLQRNNHATLVQLTYQFASWKVSETRPRPPTSNWERNVFWTDCRQDCPVSCLDSHLHLPRWHSVETRRGELLVQFFWFFERLEILEIFVKTWNFWNFFKFLDFLNF